MAHVVDFVCVISPENQVVHVWGIDFLVFTGDVHCCNAEKLQARPKNQHAHEKAVDDVYCNEQSLRLKMESGEELNQPVNED